VLDKQAMIYGAADADLTFKVMNQLNIQITPPNRTGTARETAMGIPIIHFERNIRHNALAALTLCALLLFPPAAPRQSRPHRNLTYQK